MKYKERRMFMSVAVFNKCGSEICNMASTYLQNNEMKKFNFIDKIKGNYALIQEISEKTKDKTYKKYIEENIVFNKQIRNGHPTIKGTRLTPNDVANIAYKTDMSMEKMLYEYPSLTDEQQIRRK